MDLCGRVYVLIESIHFRVFPAEFFYISIYYKVSTASHQATAGHHMSFPSPSYISSLSYCPGFQILQTALPSLFIMALNMPPQL